MKKDTNVDRSRRQFVKAGAASVVAVPLAATLLANRAYAQDKASEDDPTAQAIGYKHDASTVDNPKRTDDQTCANCQLYQGDEGTEWAPCPILGGKSVAAKGWCTAWVLKA